MTDTTLPPDGPQHDRIEPVDIQQEMQNSYIDYAMSVIVGRALPDVRDGLKPVHRRVLYAMYDNGYRPDRGYVKSARPVAETMGNYHPHGDSSIYDTLVRMAQPWSLRYPLVDGQGNFGSRGNDGAAAMRYTECRLTPLAMEMLREIDHETVDFTPNYDGKTQEPTVLPSRIPNLLINGSNGIAVGMATNIPPHNLREVAEAIYWALDNFEADEEATLAAVMERIKGPDFPTHGLIVGGQGIQDAYTTGRGSVRMRGVVEIEEDAKGRTTIVITELPYQVNPDNLITSIAEQVRDAKIGGISDIHDESSDRVGMRIVVTVKRDAVAKVVLNNLYKHTQLQTSFGCNMLSIVDGVPRTLRLDQMIRLYTAHQLEVIVRRTRYLLRKAQERAHILRGLVKALDALDEVIALIRASQTVDIARAGLMELLDVDEIQADAILGMQLRRLAALERQKIVDELAEIELEIADLEDILARPERQRAIVRDELKEIVDKYGDDRRTRIIAADGDVNDEDLIAREDVVVTITETGYAKRTKTDLYRSQKRGGKGVQGAGLKQDDIVSHFFVTSTHDWLLFFTTKGRVYRAKLTNCPRRAVPLAVSTLPTCWPSSRTSAFSPSSRSRRTKTRPTWCSPLATVWSRSPSSPTSTPTAAVASSPSTCAVKTNWSALSSAPPKTTSFSSRHRASRSASRPPTRHCVRWAAPLPVSRACVSTVTTSCSRSTSFVKERSSWSPRRAVTPSELAWRTTRCRVAAARACSRFSTTRNVALWSVRSSSTTTTSCTRSPRAAASSGRLPSRFVRRDARPRACV